MDSDCRVTAAGIPAGFCVAPVLESVLGSYGPLRSVDIDAAAGTAVVNFATPQAAAACLAASPVHIGSAAFEVTACRKRSRSPAPAPLSAPPAPLRDQDGAVAAPAPAPSAADALDTYGDPSDSDRSESVRSGAASHLSWNSDEYARPVAETDAAAGALDNDVADAPPLLPERLPGGTAPQHAETSTAVMVVERCRAVAEDSVKVGPFLLYQLLRGVALPHRIVMFRGKDASRQGPDADGEQRAAGDFSDDALAPKVRALVSFGSPEQRDLVERAFFGIDGSGVTVQLHEHPDSFRVALHRAQDQRVFAHRNTATTLVLTPQCVVRTGAIFDRRPLPLNPPAAKGPVLSAADADIWTPEPQHAALSHAHPSGHTQAAPHEAKNPAVQAAEVHVGAADRPHQDRHPVDAPARHGQRQPEGSADGHRPGPGPRHPRAERDGPHGQRVGSGHDHRDHRRPYDHRDHRGPHDHRDHSADWQPHHHDHRHQHHEQQGPREQNREQQYPPGGYSSRAPHAQHNPGGRGRGECNTAPRGGRGGEWQPRPAQEPPRPPRTPGSSGLPAGWEAVRHPEYQGEYFLYTDPRTGEQLTQWERPVVAGQR